MFCSRAIILNESGRSSLPSAGCRAAASRAWRRPLRRKSVRFQARCSCGATSSASVCSASAARSGFRARRIPRRFLPSSIRCAGNAPSWRLRVGTRSSSMRCTPRERNVTPSPRLPRVPVLASPGFGSTRPPGPCGAGLPPAWVMCQMPRRRFLTSSLDTIVGQQNFAVVDAGRPLPEVVASSLELIRPAKL